MKFKEKKAAQVAAFFIFCQRRPIGVLKLIKLMYLAERESFKKYGESITGDRFFSMDHGPVLSSTLNLVDNLFESCPDGWESWISHRAGHLLALRKDDGNLIDQLTQLSEADLEILDTTWKEYGHLTGSQLRKLTHDICFEWEDPQGSSIPISYKRLLTNVGYDNEVAEELENRIETQRKLDTILDSKRS